MKRTLVVKVGTNVLSGPDGRPNRDRIASISAQIARARTPERGVVLVSSGAVGAGLDLLGLDRRPSDLSHLQAAAAAGQARLIRWYDESLRSHGLRAAQILLGADDFRDRTRYLNARNTLATLREFAAVPIVNENDTVSTAEISLGDNDRLAVMTAGLVPAPLLVLLTSAPGLCDGDPEQGGNVISLIERWDDGLFRLARSTGTTLGTGGMASKLEAVRDAAAAGVDTILADGRDDDVIDRIVAGKPVGTLIRGEPDAPTAWKRWIGFTLLPAGEITVDYGAVRALNERGRSLLPAGVTGVAGEFPRGGPVRVLTPGGEEFARGLSNYSSNELRRVAGRRTDAIAELLGGVPDVTVIHRDNLTLTRPAAG
ncbi:glutamate 5-kinase [Alienimonas sp. DA493]|uniref:glutamate 5-kinase n=1 Tax=Alienimonas sp. DA493 TaxID=3373605 RepID=UPI003754F8C8